MNEADLSIIYEDNHLIAVNKTAGMLTQPTENEETSLEILLKAWIKAKYNKAGNAFLGVIHRLDRPVSGVVLFAKTSKALSRLNSALRAREMHKTYYARVENKPPNDKGTLENYLRHDDHRAFICQKQAGDAKLARLHYTVIKKFSNSTLLQIALETGRYHQIRAQCAYLGCPIVGDTKYGAKHLFPKGIIALHHFQLELIHPISAAPLIIEAPLPELLLQG